MTSRLRDYTGQKFSRWTVLSYVGPAPGARLWLCRCDCGTERPVSMGNLKSGTSKSCGCLQEERARETHFKHGMQLHPIYGSWAGMKDRCYNKNDQDYKYYGGRGIHVCEDWLADFWNFWEDMAGKWRPGLTIDRIDTNGNYSLFNCQWITIQEQQQNRNPRNTFS